jgi:hypothetical protein
MAEYNVSTEKDIFEAEDAALEAIKGVLKEAADEVEAEAVNVYKKLFFGYVVKVAANMVVDVSAENYLTAYHKAVEQIESLPYGNNITIINVSTYDVTLAEEKILLEKPAM